MRLRPDADLEGAQHRGSASTCKQVIPMRPGPVVGQLEQTRVQLNSASATDGTASAQLAMRTKHLVPAACAACLGHAHSACSVSLDRGLAADGTRALSAHDWMLTRRPSPPFCRCRGLFVQRVALLSRILRARRYRSLRVVRACMPRHTRAHGSTHTTRHRDAHASDTGAAAIDQSHAAHQIRSKHAKASDEPSLSG